MPNLRRVKYRRDLHRSMFIVDNQARGMRFRPSSRLGQSRDMPGNPTSRNVIEPRGHASTFPRICYQSVGEFASEVEIGQGADGLGRKEANGRRVSRGEGDCAVAAIVLCCWVVVIVSSSPCQPRLLWEGKGIYTITLPISIPHHHPHPRLVLDKTFLANSHNS
jgi:hypothetical protein